ncbi:MAG TPA: hypothetical protein PLN55_11520 [Burkholderiaceae bacterium]|nr:hypothetical protein [Burkholderiaceae bacterium]
MAGRGQIAFHSGALFFKDTAANPTPVQVATLQEVSFDFKASNKELTGENTFAEAVGRGNVKISGKAKNGRFNGTLLNQIFFKQPSSSIVSQAKLLALEESGTVATGVITVANAANYLEDLGVKGASGTPYVRVASAPTAGQYSVNESTGVYTFNTSENTNVLAISYLYKTTAAGASTLKITNQSAGEAPTFRGIFRNKFQSQELTLILTACVPESLGFGFKNEDFAMPDFAFGCQADSLGNVGELSLTTFS